MMFIVNSFIEEQRRAGKRPAPPPARVDRPKIQKPASAPAPKPTRPACPTCGRYHEGECWRATGRCFRCRDTGHRIAECPKKKIEAPQKKVRYEGRVYALTKGEAEEAPEVVSGTLLVGGAYAKVLFDSGATHTFISTSFAHQLTDKPAELFNGTLVVTTPTGEPACVDRVIPSISVAIGDYQLVAQAFVLEMHDFDMILGMDWLDQHYALLDCRRKRVIFRKPGKEEFVYQCPRHKTSKVIVSALRATRLLSQGCTGFLACIVLEKGSEKTVTDIRVVQEFPDVFPDELSGLPPVREIDFAIELMPWTQPISIAPYRMAPAELAELKKQL